MKTAAKSRRPSVVAKHRVTINRRVYRRLLRAEAVCRETRIALAYPWKADWKKVADLVIVWLRLATKEQWND